MSAGATMTAPALRKVYDEVHFPLMVPHLIAQGSTLSTDDGVRGFKPLKNQHEVAMTFNINGGDEYWQIEESTWNSAPILAKPTGTIPYRGGKLLLYTTGGSLQMVALRTRRRDVLGREHDPQPALELDDDRDREEPPARCTTEQRDYPSAVARIAIFGAGYVGLVTGACFADLGHEVVVRDVLPERIERLQAGEVPIYEPGLDEVLERCRDRLSFTLDVREAVDGADFLYVAVGTPPTYAGDADLSAVWTVVDELPDDAPRDDRDEVAPSRSGTGEKVRAALDARGLEAVGYVSNPEFTAEGTAVRDFMEPDRVVIGAFADEDGDAVEALHGGIDAPVVRADVNSAEMIKLAANAFLVDAHQLHQRDRERLRARRRRRQRRRRGHRARSPARAALPARGHRLRRLVLPEGLARAEAARRELGLPLPPPARREGGERAAEAPRRCRSCSSISAGCAASRRAARARVQAEHRRHARGAEPRDRLAAARRGRGGARRGIRSRGRDLQGVEFCDYAARGRERRRRRRDRDRVAGAARLAERGDCATRCAHPLIVDGRNLLDPEAVRAAGFAYEGIGRRISATDVLPEAAERELETSE